jgi:hypothetical protein
MGNAFRLPMPVRFLPALALAAASLVVPALAGEARASYLLVELDTGFGTSAYEPGPIGLAYGASAGTTLKLSFLPLRFYFLGTIVARNATAEGIHQGLLTTAERRDLDLYLSERTVLPVWGPLRLYAELGVGERWTREELHRGSGLGPLSASGSEMIVVVAAGVEARLSEMFSIGVRGELLPLTSDLDLAHYAADFAPRSARTALMGQIGVHF